MAAPMTCKPFLGSRIASQAAAARRPSARLQVQAAADRPVWLPGINPPSYLKGNEPGDRGFDPLGLGADPDRFKWYAEGERTNARWAMAAVAGIMGQEALGVSPEWYKAGLKEYALPPLALLGIEFLVLGFLELKRFQGWKKTGQSGFIDWFPFDPAGMNSDSMAEKEIKNGRLAMVAFIGFAVQALVTRQGPLAALGAHLSDPFGNNIITNIGNLPNVIGSSTGAAVSAAAERLST